MKEKKIISKAIDVNMPNIEEVRKNCITQNIQPKKIKFIWIKRLVPIAACIILVLTIGINWGPKNIFSANKVESGRDIIKTEVFINELSTGLSEDRAIYNLSWDDFVSMEKEELIKFYGVNIFPTVIPNDIFEVPEEVKPGVFKRDKGKGEVYHSQNLVNYYSNDFTRSINIEVAKGEIPFTCVSFNVDNNDVKESIINNNPVTIGHYIANADSYYYALFIYKDVGFIVSATNLTQTEFIDMLSSILK